jgi:hypothetical protein
MTRTSHVFASFAFLLTIPATALAVAPANDNIARATVVASLPFGSTQVTVDGTPEPGDPSCAGVGPTVWYRFTPRTAMRLEVNTFGSDYDTTLSVYNRSGDEFEQLACVDDTVGVQSRIRLDVQAGRTYWIMVGAFGGGSGGNLVFTMQVAPPFVPLRLTMALASTGSVQPSTGAAAVSGTVTCNTPAAVEISGQLRQKPGGRDSVGYFGLVVDCNGTTAWSAPVSPQLGRFRGRSLSLFTGGAAQVSAGAHGWTEESTEYVQADRSIRLRGSR